MKSPFEKIVLKNGVRLILVPMSGVNSVAISVMVGVGSRYETKANNGVSHFLEHMTFKGTKKFPTTDDVNIVERSGGLQNAYTDIDITSYHNKVLASDWQLALDINKELCLNPLIEEKHIDRERDVILEEMKRSEDDPGAKVDEVFHQMMYPGTTLGMRVIGEKDSLIRSNASTLRAYHDMWYRPDRIVVVVAGNIGKLEESLIKRHVEEWFSRLHNKSSGNFKKVVDRQVTPAVQIVTKPDVQQAHLIIGLRTFPRAHDHRFAWHVFNLLMGVGFTSRFFKEIREKRGLCYHIRSSSSNWHDVGYWSIYAGVATEKVKEATRAILAELAKAKEKGVTEEEISIAKKRIKTMIAFSSENPEFINEYYGRQELHNEPKLTLEEYLVKIDAVTKEDINDLLKKYFIGKTLNLALVWNKPSDDKLSDFLIL